MSVEHHDLHHEFPELHDRIHELKLSDAHFRKLFEEYHELTRSIEKMEDEVTPVSTETEEQAKVRRVHLKDELYRMLTAA
jgi:uncharacterized protein YdcH (DUF465 family)